MTPSTDSTQSINPMRGVALIAVAVLFFAVGDVLTKYLTMRYPVPQVMAVRYLSSLLILLVFVWPRIGRDLWRSTRPTLVLLRGGVLVLASLSMGLALRVMPVGETISIMFLSPFAVLALAVPLLGERVTEWNWFLAAVGFSGVLLILRPGGGLDPVGVGWALFNAGCATAFHLMTRALSRTESAISMLFYVTLVGTISFGATAIPTIGEQATKTSDLYLMVALGATATMGHFLFASAYRFAPASVIAPINYLHLVWAGLLGWAVFGDVPGLLTLVGMGLIVLAGAALASQQRSRRPR